MPPQTTSTSSTVGKRAPGASMPTTKSVNRFDLPDEDKPKSSEVVFSIVAPAAKKVFVAGDFTEWEKRPIELTKSDGGKWQVKVPLPKGKQQYRFIVDGEWHDDPSCKEKVRNNFGSTNAVIQIT